MVALTNNESRTWTQGGRGEDDKVRANRLIESPAYQEEQVAGINIIYRTILYQAKEPVPRGQKMLQRHLPRVIYRQV